ncbi:MAG: ammonia channel protein [Flavobacteriales bacterium]|nr:MAG: ammonia channel protein [Flavobacteriales bacterium]
MNKKLVSLFILSGLLLPSLSYGQAGVNTISSGDTAWMLMATALVMLMTPAGLALFYGGLTRSKSVLNTIGMSYIAFCVGTLAWVIIGYSLAFEGSGSIIGTLDNVLLRNIEITDVKGTIPSILFVAFQGTFAAIAVAIVSGSIIERVKFSTWIIFALLWVVFIYSPVAHWVWGGGFLSNDGELDFAGGTVIHINAGVAGLVVAYLLGKRKDFSVTNAKPASIKLTVLGSALLWFGWFGFNAGSELAADFIAANALMVTNVAACAGGIVWLIIEWYDAKKPTLIGSASGVVSGLVAITPAAGYVDVTGALCIGLLGGLVGYLGAVKLKKMLGYDDSLDAFGIHGLVGILGAVLTGVFANPAINKAAGLLYGNPGQVLIQLKAVAVTIIFSAIGTFIVFKVSALLTRGARVNEVVEYKGLDKMIHGEKGFDLHEEVIQNEVIKN